MLFFYVKLKNSFGLRLQQYIADCSEDIFYKLTLYCNTSLCYPYSCQDLTRNWIFNKPVLSIIGILQNRFPERPESQHRQNLDPDQLLVGD